jgi:serine/threonine protein kinase
VSLIFEQYHIQQFQVNVLVSDEGRGQLTTHFSMHEIVTATSNASEIRSSDSYSLRFRAPERAKSGMSQETDIWSFGCLCYEVTASIYYSH